MIYAIEFSDNHILRGRQVLIEASDDWQASRKLTKDPKISGGQWPVPFKPEKHTHPMKSDWITQEDFRACIALIQKHMEGK